MTLSILRIPSILLLATLASAITLGTATAVFAEESAPSVHVRISDLDLSKPQGSETLYRRLRTAARVVCYTYEDRLGVRDFAWKACVDQALDRAVAEVANAQLSAIHLAQTGHSKSDAARVRKGAETLASAPAAMAN
jgi:UrcA family protein